MEGRGAAMMETPRPIEQRAPRRLSSDIGRFGIVPLWLLESHVSDKAIRLFALLAARYADREGVAFPSLQTLARGLHIVNRRSVTAAAKELVSVGAVAIESRRRAETDGGFLNVYQLRYARPDVHAAVCAPAPGLSAPVGAKTPPPGGGENDLRVGAKTPQQVGSFSPPDPDPVIQTHKPEADFIPRSCRELRRQQAQEAEGRKICDWIRECGVVHAGRCASSTAHARRMSMEAEHARTAV